MYIYIYIYIYHIYIYIIYLYVTYLLHINYTFIYYNCQRKFNGNFQSVVEKYIENKNTK